MSDETLKLIDLINKEKTISEISSEMNLSYKQLYHRLTLLSNKGFKLVRKYYYSGDTRYAFSHNIKINNTVNLITSPNDQIIKLLAISDPHIGSIHERLDLLDKVYDFCSGQGIHIILISGGFIEGICDKNRNKHKNIYDQLDYAIKNYPHDPSILNFCVFGNHDFSVLKECGLDFSVMLSNMRQDIVSLGYNQGTINIKDDFLILEHPLTTEKIPKNNYSNCLIIKGHSHKMKLKTSTSHSMIYIPTLSDWMYSEESSTGFVKMNLTMQNGYIFKGVFEHFMIIENNIYKINEMDINLGLGKNFTKKHEISNEENPPKKKVLK